MDARFTSIADRFSAQNPDCSLRLFHSNSQVYACDVDAKIGNGAYGVVYKCYRVDSESLAIDRDHPLAAKKFCDIDQFNADEIEFFKRYYKVGDVGFNGLDLYLVMDYLPGDNLYRVVDAKPTLSEKIAQLDFYQRICLIQNILLFISLIHHNTPATGTSITHNDLNGANIRADIDVSTGKYDAYICDFALAKDVSDDPDLVAEQPMDGTPLYMPPEVYAAKRGLKSDIYALSPVFMILLGATQPFTIKQAFSWVREDYYKAGYSFQNIFKGLLIPSHLHSVLPYIIIFLSQMHNSDYDYRPDVDQALRFFTTLQNYILSTSVDTDEESRCVRAAILALLASGLWVILCKKLDQKPFEFSFEKLYLHSHLAFCKDVLVETGYDDLFSIDDHAVDEIKKKMLTPEKLGLLLSRHGITPEADVPEVVLSSHAGLFAPVDEGCENDGADAVASLRTS